MKIRPVGAELLQAYGRTDRRNEAFRNFANAPEIGSILFVRRLQPLLYVYHAEITIKEYTGCPRRNGQNFGRVFPMLKYTDITQNTYIQS